MSKCHVTELRCKEVINDVDGERLGLVGDVLVDTECGRVVKLLVYGRSKFLGLFGREEDIHIPWEDVRVVGEETILVCLKNPPKREISHSQRGNSSVFSDFFK